LENGCKKNHEKGGVLKIYREMRMKKSDYEDSYEEAYTHQNQKGMRSVSFPGISKC
jgi:O-acetyl-ADP-ribose deacetylase (regulator of RNase III)